MRKTVRELEEKARNGEGVVENLKLLYKKTVLPLEREYNYDMMFSEPLSDVDFDSKPMVLVLGQYSVGKTTFIKNIIGRDFPGNRIGPEPTTDRFQCVYYSKQDESVPGSVLQMNPYLPFRPLGQFGNNFLNKLEGSSCSAEALKSFMFVDTPGVLSGKKQINRQYPFKEVTEWFADKAARILILFDCSKLDISDEFKAVIRKLRKHDDKIRIVLNKADSITPKELIRVYGALMWNLGKVFDTPEVLKVYISSFHAKPFDKTNLLSEIFEGDSRDLIAELKGLHKQQMTIKVNQLLKRMRNVKVHAQIMADLKTSLPKWWGKRAKQRQLSDTLPEQFARIARKTAIPLSDFPSVEEFKGFLISQKLSTLPKSSQFQRHLSLLDTAMSSIMPKLVRKLLVEEQEIAEIKEQEEIGGSEEKDDRFFNPFSPSSDEAQEELPYKFPLQTSQSMDSSVLYSPSGLSPKVLDRLSHMSRGVDDYLNV